ncbi:MAG: DUF5694 domain-containing protein [Acidobacteriota bacterium]|nr:DUF5694 domain-containing protein [Acidobacteriota bacterium]
MRNFCCLILLVLIAAVSSIQSQNVSGVSPKDTSCSDKSAKLMILGTYHMDNPRLDAKNLDADDVLLPKRQREITELIEKLARFNPTKIAVEAPYSEKVRWNDRYKKFLTGEHKLTRNEIEQIGFQLARRLNHGAIYPIDYPMFMSGLNYDEIEFPKPKPTPLTTNNGNTKKPEPPPLSEGDLLLRRSSVTEFLLLMNNLEKARKDHGENYLQQLLPNDNPAIYESADRIANWYKRNLRMFANINRITDFPNDRILLIVGSGHLTILRDFALDSPQFCLVEAETYLK